MATPGVIQRMLSRTPRAASASPAEGGFSVLRAASELLSRMHFGSRAGITFHGERDLYRALGYKRRLKVEDYRDRYARGGVAARIIEAKPQATWRGGAELVEDEDPETETAFEEAFSELDKRLHVWTVFQRADTLAGLGEYGVIFVGAPGPVEAPLEHVRGVDDIFFLAPYGQDEAEVGAIETDPTNPRFGLPQNYKLKHVRGAIHHSRVIHVADGILDSVICGIPRLERIWNYLDDLDKVSGCSAESFWLRANQGMQVNIDKDVVVDPDALADLKVQVKEYEHGLRRALTTRGADVTMFGSDVANSEPHIKSIISLISGATEIPQRILLGSERGELASTQDKSTWDERIRDRRSSYGEPVIVRPFVDRLIEIGALPEPETYTVRWPEVDELEEVDRAMIADIWAGLNKKIGAVVITPAEIRDRVLLLDPLEEQDIPEELKVVAPDPAAQQQPDPNADPNAPAPVEPPA